MYGLRTSGRAGPRHIVAKQAGDVCKDELFTSSVRGKKAICEGGRRGYAVCQIEQKNGTGTRARAPDARGIMVCVRSGRTGTMVA